MMKIIYSLLFLISLSSFTYLFQSQSELRINPQSLSISECGDYPPLSIEVKNASQLFGVELKIRYDPDIIEILDFDDSVAGVQVQRDNRLKFVAVNKIEDGLLSFAATGMSEDDNINGTAKLITVNWQPIGQGTSPIQIESAILSDNEGNSLAFTKSDGEIKVLADCATIYGKVLLQSRSNHQGIIIRNEKGQETETNSEGEFAFVGSSEKLSAHHQGYLSAESPPVIGTNLGRITLLGGDIDGDNDIDIFDLSALSSKLDSTDSQTDLNGDGRVTILDLSLLAGNYHKEGPLRDWTQ